MPSPSRFRLLTLCAGFGLMASAQVSATPVTSGLELWLDASTISAGTTSVSTWADQSGNGRDATASGSATPTYIASNAFFSGRATVSFDGNDFMSSALASSMGITGNSARTIFFAFSQDSSASRNILGYGTNSGGNLFDVAATGQRIAGHFFGSPFVGSGSSQSFTLNQMTVGTALYDGTNFQTYLHDDAFSGLASSTAYALTTGDSNFRIGGGMYSSYNNFNGDIAEVLVYSGALSAADRSAIDGYLRTKYTTAAVAEPGALALACLGLLGVFATRRRESPERLKA